MGGIALLRSAPRFRCAPPRSRASPYKKIRRNPRACEQAPSTGISPYFFALLIASRKEMVIFN